MRRRQTITAAASLLLLLAISALWVRSFWGEDGLVFHNASRQRILDIASGRGRLGIGYFKDPSGDTMTLPDHIFASKAPARYYPDVNSPVFDIPHKAVHFVGFGYDRIEFFGVDMWIITVPLWFLAALLIVVPARWWWRGRGRSRIALSCVQCGYDLRATPERCPECGRSALAGNDVSRVTLQRCGADAASSPAR